MSTLSGLDWAALAVLTLSMVVGLWRGLVFELMSLAGWAVAYVGAQYAAADVAQRLPVGAPGSAINMAAGFALAFAAVLLAWSLFSRLVRMALSATPLTVPDRFLGAAFGVVRAGLLLLAVATVVNLTPAARSSAWQQSQAARWLGVVLHGLKPLLPAPMQPYLPD